MDAMFLKFADDLDNLTGGSLSVSDNLANERILLINSPGMEKPISLCVVHFSQAIGVCVQKTFPVRCHQWTDVDGDYIEVVKDNVQWFFVLDFNDQAMNRHFKKYNDLEEVHATQPNLLMLSRVCSPPEPSPSFQPRRKIRLSRSAHAERSPVQPVSRSHRPKLSPRHPSRSAVDPSASLVRITDVHTPSRVAPLRSDAAQSKRPSAAVVERSRGVVGPPVAVAPPESGSQRLIVRGPDPTEAPAP
ncbi:CACTA en-spm transposon protein [Cucumis melo var. makuwa]|uniref:CACTA en-spm transposon protein n=1 Tax=Cucumis melo var. makuwa TaxID=1194695 RepID=A0A5D3DTB1_CUCMM|nr:CACTA en-spm transposon protein [Cucumis melo var. makuwa]